MDDAAVSVYQQEMARRGLTLPKKEPTPRKPLSVVEPEVVKHRKVDPAIKALECAKWYLANPDLTLDAVATLSREKWGKAGYRSGASVGRALEGLGIKRRAKPSTAELALRKLEARYARVLTNYRSVSQRLRFAEERLRHLEGAA